MSLGVQNCGRSRAGGDGGGRTREPLAFRDEGRTPSGSKLARNVVVYLNSWRIPAPGRFVSSRFNLLPGASSAREGVSEPHVAGERETGRQTQREYDIGGERDTWVAVCVFFAP